MIGAITSVKLWWFRLAWDWNTPVRIRGKLPAVTTTTTKAQSDPSTKMEARSFFLPFASSVQPTISGSDDGFEAEDKGYGNNDENSNKNGIDNRNGASPQAPAAQTILLLPTGCYLWKLALHRMLLQLLFMPKRKRCERSSSSWSWKRKRRRTRQPTKFSVVFKKIYLSMI